jgi:hypothetical protein
MAQTVVKPNRPPLILSLEQVADLSAYLGLNLSTAEQLVQRVHELTLVSVEGVQVTFKPAVLQRLKTRALKNDFGPWLRDRIREWANSYVGV